MAFPSSPIDGQTYTTALGTQYKYVEADTAWKIDGVAGGSGNGTVIGSGTLNTVAKFVTTGDSTTIGNSNIISDANGDATVVKATPVDFTLLNTTATTPGTPAVGSINFRGSSVGEDHDPLAANIVGTVTSGGGTDYIHGDLSFNTSGSNGMIRSLNLSGYDVDIGDPAERSFITLHANNTVVENYGESDLYLVNRGACAILNEPELVYGIHVVGGSNPGAYTLPYVVGDNISKIDFIADSTSTSPTVLAAGSIEIHNSTSSLGLVKVIDISNNTADTTGNMVSIMSGPTVDSDPMPHIDFFGKSLITDPYNKIVDIAIKGPQSGSVPVIRFSLDGPEAVSSSLLDSSTFGVIGSLSGAMGGLAGLELIGCQTDFCTGAYNGLDIIGITQATPQPAEESWEVAGANVRIIGAGAFGDDPILQVCNKVGSLNWPDGDNTNVMVVRANGNLTTSSISLWGQDSPGEYHNFTQQVTDVLPYNQPAKILTGVDTGLEMIGISNTACGANYSAVIVRGISGANDPHDDNPCISLVGSKWCGGVAVTDTTAVPIAAAETLLAIYNKNEGYAETPVFRIRGNGALNVRGIPTYDDNDDAGTNGAIEGDIFAVAGVTGDVLHVYRA